MNKANLRDLIAATVLVISIWWIQQMETFPALLALFAGNSPVTIEFPSQRLMTRSFDVLFDVRPNRQLSKQSWGWWFIDAMVLITTSV